MGFCFAFRSPACIAATLVAFALTFSHISLADDGDNDGASASISRPKIDWAERVRQAQIHEGEPLLLVMHSAKDCKYCARWKGLLGGKPEYESWIKSHPDDHLIIVEREAMASIEEAVDYPEDLRWLFERKQQRGNIKPETPTFEIVLGQKVLWRSAGYRSWDQDVFPAIKDLDSRRLAAISNQ